MKLHNLLSTWTTRSAEHLSRRTRRREFAIESLESRHLLSAGDLDLTGGNAGKVLTNIGDAPSSSRAVEVVAYQSDGKLVVAGESDDGGGNFAVVRYNSDGSLDTSFGVDGIVTVDFGGTYDVAWSVAADNSDRIVVAGYSYQGATGWDFAVARLTTEGALDTSFDTDGKQTVDFGSDDYGQSVAVDSADRVIVAGSSYQGAIGNDFAVARLTTDGALDTSFGADGKQTLDFNGQSVAVDSADRVLVAGYSYYDATGYDFAVTRLTTDGTLDTAFGADGIQVVDFGSLDDEGLGVALDSSGNVIVVGYSNQGGTTGYDFAVLRLTTDGALDLSFDTDGRLTIDFGSSDDGGWAVAVDSQDRILLAGWSDGSTTNYDFAVVRLLGDSMPPNQLPVANAGGTYTVGEGANLQLNGSGSSDPEDGTALTYEWDLDYDGFTFDVDDSGVQPSVSFPDNFLLRTIGLRVTDSGVLSHIDTATLVVTNVSPSVGVITAPVDPVAVTTVINVSADFTDVGVQDTHMAEWDWGDGSISSAGTVAETNGSGSATGSHAYSVPGVYTVTLTVTDKDSDSEQSSFQYVVVYDPSAGFVTGGGWIDSPLGACAANPALIGKANFGFVAKYQKGANTPTGNTEFQFKAGDFTLRSTDYQWLVVAGENAKFKGTGTVNGQAGFQFMITAHDGQVQGADGIDKFRIKVWNAGGVVYDNQSGLADDSQAATALGGGSIVIHKGGNNLMLDAVVNGARSGAARLDDSQLSTALADAVAQWAAQGLSSTQVDRLRDIKVVWADLPGNTLGLASESTNYVWIDRDAAGYGWSLTSEAPVGGRVDLFSALTHELEHARDPDVSPQRVTTPEFEAGISFRGPDGKPIYPQRPTGLVLIEGL